MNGNYNGYSGGPGGDRGGYSFQTIMDIKSRNRGFAIASMILGIFSILCCCFTYIGLIIGVLSIVFAVVSRVRMGYFDGMAIAGLVLGIIGVVFSAAIIVVDTVFAEQYLEWFEANYPDIYEQIEGSNGAGTSL